MGMWYEDQSKIASLFVVVTAAYSISLLPGVSHYFEQFTQNTGLVAVLYGIVAALFSFPFFYASDPERAISHSVLVGAIYIEITAYGISKKYVEFQPIVIAYFIFLFYHAQSVVDEKS